MSKVKNYKYDQIAHCLLGKKHTHNRRPFRNQLINMDIKNIYLRFYISKDTANI